MFLELAIHAQVAAIACFVIALSRHHSVQASLITVVRDVVVLEVSLFLGLGAAVARLDFVAFGSLALTLEVNVAANECEELETVSEPLEPRGVVLEHLDDVGVLLFLDLFAVFLSLHHNRLGLDLDFALLHWSI
jgi:hypothetical protein